MKIKSKTITLIVSFILGAIINLSIMPAFISAFHLQKWTILILFVIYFFIGFCTQKVFIKKSNINIFYTLPFIIWTTVPCFIFGVATTSHLGSFLMLGLSYLLEIALLSLTPLVAYLVGILVVKKFAKKN